MDKLTRQDIADLIASVAFRLAVVTKHPQAAEPGADKRMAALLKKLERLSQ